MSTTEDHALPNVLPYVSPDMTVLALLHADPDTAGSRAVLMDTVPHWRRKKITRICEINFLAKRSLHVKVRFDRLLLPGKRIVTGVVVTPLVG